ncbi:MAG: GNAT family N-acetyltransferase [Pyrinomonadaceae bacterium]|nr:GNAT family N-acetyltransferase [Pyrinomonadaceae bacterium]
MVSKNKSSYQLINSPELSSGQKRRVVELWNAEYPASLQFGSIEKFEEYLSALGEKTHFLIVDVEEKIAAWSMIFERDSAKWFAIIVDRAAQGLGFGRRLVDEMRAREPEIFGWVISTDEYRRSDGEAYHSPIKFYKKLGFTIVQGETLEKQGISGIKIVWRGKV